jgi:hypothetical protein
MSFSRYHRYQPVSDTGASVPVPVSPVPAARRGTDTGTAVPGTGRFGVLFGARPWV